MLMQSDINPFDSQETKPYKNDPRISAMTDLVDAFQRDDIHRYETILQKNKDLLEDPFIADNIEEVTRNMRTKALLKLIAPYTRFTLAFVAKQLKISATEVQDIVGFLIIDKKLKGKIDQAKGTVEVESSLDVDRTKAMNEWTNALKLLWSMVLNEGEGFRSEDSSQMLGGTAAPGFPPSHFDFEGSKQSGGRSANGWGRGRGGQKRGGGRAQMTGTR